MFVIKYKSPEGRIKYFTKTRIGWTENINHAYKCFYKRSAEWLVSSLGKGEVERF